MGQNASVHTRSRRKSFRSTFSRRSNSQHSNLSATFVMPDSDHKIEQLNINLANEEELMTLPGITRAIAQSIVEHRRMIGRFKKVEDLALVSGIGAEKFDKIRPEICVTKRKAHSCTSSRAQSMDSLKSMDSNRTGSKTPKPIDVNKATVFDLQSINGLTQELAANIVHYREKKGPFNSLDGLLKVKGINPIRLGAIRIFLTITNDLDEVSEKPKNGLIHSYTVANGIANSSYTSRHRKSLSAPMNFSMNLGNGFSKPPINDIFDLLSAYSYRPIVEEDFRYERNGEKALRVASWNLHRLSQEKAENLGFKEVVCRTILENRLSLLAIQDVLDVSALRLICEELNHPTLRRIYEWKDNSRDWNYCLSDVQTMLSDNVPSVGYIYDRSSGGNKVTLESTRTVPLPCSNGLKSEAALAKFSIDDFDLTLLNMFVQSDGDYKSIIELISEHVAKDEVLVLLGDFTKFTKSIDEFTSNLQFMNILPVSTNTSSVSVNPHNHLSTLRFSDNILLSGAAKVQYTGVSGVVRQGLSHMAIPRGWSWGGPASEHCPVWCEIFINHKAQDSEVKENKPVSNGICIQNI